MGRTPWSDKRTVEDCSALDIRCSAELFASPHHYACPISWNSGLEVIITYRENSGVDPSKPLGWEWGMVPKGAPKHREEACGSITISRPAPDSWTAVARQIEQTVEVVAIPSVLKRGRRFGAMKRYYFRCPGLGAAPCRNRVSKIYLPRGEDSFACRACHNLTYESVKEHDWRVDAIRKLPLDQLGQLLECPDTKMSLLALKALGRWMK